MFKVIFSNMPDAGIILSDNGLDCYFSENVYLKPNEIKIMTFDNMSYNFINSVGIPFHKHRLSFSLYYPEGSFKWIDKKKASIAIINRTSQSISIEKGSYMASVKFMSLKYFEYWKKHNNSDRGLMSVPIKIEIEE